MRVVFVVAVVVAALVAAASAVPAHMRRQLGDEMPAVDVNLVHRINKANVGWVADANQPFWNGATVRDAKNLMGVKPGHFNGEGVRLPVKSQEELDREAPVDALPASFDSREEWPHCVTIGEIRDQSACGSCWAFSAAEAMSDRYCTYGLNENLVISPNNLNSCDPSSYGCQGGYPSAAWSYWVSAGLVDDACSPYPFPSCQHHGQGAGQPCPPGTYPTPPCVKKCNNSEVWNKALHYGASASSASGAKAIMQEIYAHGPVQTAFTVYSDFLTYRSGVYKHTQGSMLGGHAVKIIGWGVTSGPKPQKYWIVNNSWNSGWGQNGTFWILKGVNECGIENEVDFGIPKN